MIDPDAPDTDEDAARPKSGAGPDVSRKEGEEIILPHVVTIQPIRDPQDEPFVFRFELGPAILQQLLVKLESLTPLSLAKCLRARHPGFYQLFIDGDPVYIGKTSRTVGERLREHVRKLRGRVDIDRMTCRFAYVEDPSLVDVSEGALIRFFDQLNAAEWNHSGFGSKVTGYGRGRQRASNWSSQYPPDFRYFVTAGAAEGQSLIQIISQVAKSAPITLSIPTKFRAAFRSDHSDTLYRSEKTKPFVVWVRWIEQLLGPSWKVDRTKTGWYIIKVEQ